MTPEPVGISPRVDCVFKRLMTDRARPQILRDFLTAVLAPERPFQRLVVTSAEHGPAWLGDDAISVDVEATDADGRIFQIEMQTTNERHLRERMLYTWADL